MLNKLLFKIDPEKAHEIVKKFLKFPLPYIYFKDEILRVNIKGLILENPLGLAAGFDKNAEMRSLPYMGFGYVTLGSVLKEESKGNPKPRLIRYEKSLSMVNSMGLPSVGLKKFIINLSKFKTKKPIFISIAGNTIEEYIYCYKILSRYCNAIEINVSCPNTVNGRLFQDKDNFKLLIQEIKKIKNVLTFIKISPPISKYDWENLSEIINISLKNGIDGITAINTLQVKDKNIALGYGGLSGKLIYNIMLNVIKHIYKDSNGKLIINACGGIFDAKDAFKAILCGASTFQIYTSLIYKGILLPFKINKDLAFILRMNKFNSLEEAKGYIS